MGAVEILFNVMMTIMFSMVCGLAITQALSFTLYNALRIAYDENTIQRDIMNLSGIDFLSSLLSAKRSSMFVLLILSIKWDYRQPMKFVAKHRLLEDTPGIEQLAWWILHCYLANIILLIAQITTITAIYIIEYIQSY